MRGVRAQRRVHAVLTGVWLALAVPSVLLLGWRESVPYLVFLSVYAIVTGLAGGERRAQPLPDRGGPDPPARGAA